VGRPASAHQCWGQLDCPHHRGSLDMLAPMRVRVAILPGHLVGTSQLVGGARVGRTQLPKLGVSPVTEKRQL